MALDLSSLTKAINALDYAVGEAHNDQFINRLTSQQQDLIRVGVIQHFEFTYELCWKFMQRWLAENIGRVYVDGISRREMFRLAAEHRLLSDVEAWWGYHAARNLTSHIYDEDVAEEVFQTATKFLSDAQAFLAALTERND
jgi:nucleotidyltransferase substrate binding protein (TIGR01987 family)